MSELLILAARQIDLPSFYDDLGAPGRYGGRKTGERNDGERKAPNFNRPKMVVEAIAKLSVEKLGSNDDYKECRDDDLPGFLVSEISSAMGGDEPRSIRKALTGLELKGKVKKLNDGGWTRWRVVK